MLDIREHLEHAIQEFIDRGLTPVEARRQAMLKFGNLALIKENTRAVWIRPALDAIRQDVQDAVRMLRRNPGLAAALIVTLALGVGANSAIFSVINRGAAPAAPVPGAGPPRLVSQTGGPAHLSTLRRTS